MKDALLRWSQRLQTQEHFFARRGPVQRKLWLGKKCATSIRKVLKTWIVYSQEYTDPKYDTELLFVNMIVIFVNYYGKFLVVRLEKPINLMRPRTTCNIFKLFYTQSEFYTLVRVLYRGPCFISSPQSVVRSPLSGNRQIDTKILDR